MFHKPGKRAGWLVILLLGVLAVAGCSQAADAAGTADIGMIAAAPGAAIVEAPAAVAAAAAQTNAGQVETAAAAPERPAGNGNGSGGDGCPAGCPPPPSGDLSDAEAAALLFMREEEKLARDVYLLLFATWDMPVFQTIGASEQVHMDSVLGLLQTYGLDDPAAGLPAGQFANTDLQALYDALIVQGADSMADALLVGGAIEELDILDLDARLAATDNADISWVFGNLRGGSENHLRAFVTTYERQTALTYAPQYLPQDAFDLIMNGTSGHGEQQRQGGGNGGNGSGGYGNGGAGHGGGRRSSEA